VASVTSPALRAPGVVDARARGRAAQIALPAARAASAGA